MDTTSTHPRWGLPPVEQGYGGMMADAAENIVVTAQRRSVYAPPPPPPPPPPAPAMAPPEALGDLKYYRLPFRVDVSAKGQEPVALLATDRKSPRLNSTHQCAARIASSASQKK